MSAEQAGEGEHHAESGEDGGQEESDALADLDVNVEERVAGSIGVIPDCRSFPQPGNPVLPPMLLTRCAFPTTSS